ncbi:unnamed protein product [Ixodes pacificus]
MTVSEIKKNATLFVEDRKHCNKLVDIIAGLKSDADDIVVASIQACNKVFCHVLKTSNVLTEDHAQVAPETQKALQKYNAWLREKYAESQKQILQIIADDSTHRRHDIAVQVLMKWIELETVGKKQGEHHVPVEKLASLIGALLSPKRDGKGCISKFNHFLELADVRTYALKTLAQASKDWDSDPDESEKEQYLKNLYHLLLGFNMTAPVTADDEPVPVLGGTSTNFLVNREQDIKRISSVWIAFLRQKLPVKLYKELLILLPDKVVPHLHNPLLVADFFIESYNRGGTLSLMALNGLFMLIHRYHLDYPYFYEKLYKLMVPEVFYQKYRARFFFLTDLFLSSTHLPAYLVAAFAKRLARMSLVAPPYALLYVVPFIGNLLVRHRSLATMINDSGDVDASTDPYDAEEPDPAKARAAESSLWELKTLQSHWHPTIAKKAKFINDNLPKMEWDFSERLEEGYTEMVRRAKSAKHKEAPTNFHNVEGLLKQKEEFLSELWSLE